MSAAGRFAVSRAVWKHRELAGEPFTRREAWLWMVSEAAWRPRVIKIRGLSVTLERGQLAHSTRYMAQVWKWHHSRVRRFISHLLREEMADTATDTVPDTVARILTICNYGKFQFENGQTDTATDTATDTRKNKYLENKILTLARKSEGEGFYAMFGSPELEAWEQHERSTGRTFPRDKRGGWQFPAQWPPRDDEQGTLPLGPVEVKQRSAR